MAKAKSKTKKATKKVTKRNNVFYIMSPQCGWCKKADPIVDELRKDGYDITTLDVTTPDGGKQANDIKQKFNLQCGTPLLVEEKTGASVCGFREKDVLVPWFNGEELPAPPRPKSPMPRPPFLNATESEVEKWKVDYETWCKENDHLPNKKTSDELLNMPRPKSQPPQPPNPSMTNEDLEMWSVEWDEWAMDNKHLPGLQPSNKLLERFKPQWANQRQQLEKTVNENNVEVPEKGFYYFFSPQCAFCSDTSKQINDLD